MTMNEKRQAKYPDNKYFKYFNPNPKGRITTDCVIRAVAGGCNVTWQQAFDMLAEAGRKEGYTVNERKNLDKVLKEAGWTRMKQPKHDDGTKVTVKDLIDYYSTFGKPVRIIASVGAHHVVAIFNSEKSGREYKVHDIWDSSKEKVGVYYIDEVPYISVFDSGYKDSRLHK